MDMLDRSQKAKQKFRLFASFVLDKAFFLIES